MKVFNLMARMNQSKNLRPHRQRFDLQLNNRILLPATFENFDPSVRTLRIVNQRVRGKVMKSRHTSPWVSVIKQSSFRRRNFTDRIGTFDEPRRADFESDSANRWERCRVAFFYAQYIVGRIGILTSHLKYRLRAGTIPASIGELLNLTVLCLKYSSFDGMAQRKMLIWSCYSLLTHLLDFNALLH